MNIQTNFFISRQTKDVQLDEALVGHVALMMSLGTDRRRKSFGYCACGV